MLISIAASMSNAPANGDRDFCLLSPEVRLIRKKASLL